MLPLLSGRCSPGWEETDARLLGRLVVGSREGAVTPNDRRLTPESRPPLIDEAAEACDVRFRPLRSVTLLGMW